MSTGKPSFPPVPVAVTAATPNAMLPWQLLYLVLTLIAVAPILARL